MHNSSTNKGILIVDETDKTTNRVRKKHIKHKYKGLRRQLINDQLLKNYYVFDNEKDQMTVYRIVPEECNVTRNVVVESNIETRQCTVRERVDPSCQETEKSLSYAPVNNILHPINDAQLSSDQQWNDFLIRLLNILVEIQQEPSQ